MTRFSDLPVEVRQKIYRALFRSHTFRFDVDVYSVDENGYHSNYMNILLVSKLCNAEAQNASKGNVHAHLSGYGEGVRLIEKAEAGKIYVTSMVSELSIDMTPFISTTCCRKVQKRLITSVLNLKNMTLVERISFWVEYEQSTVPSLDELIEGHQEALNDVALGCWSWKENMCGNKMEELGSGTVSTLARVKISFNMPGGGCIRR